MYGFSARKVFQSVVKPILDERMVFSELPFRVVVIDNLETLRSNEQEMLRNIVESPSTGLESCTCQFIFVCNTSVTAAARYLWSRCTMLSFPSFDTDTLAQCLKHYNRVFDFRLSANDCAVLVNQHQSASSLGINLPVLLANATIRSEFYHSNSAIPTEDDFIGFGKKPATSSLPSRTTSTSRAPPGYQFPVYHAHIETLISSLLYNFGGCSTQVILGRYQNVQQQIDKLLKHFSCRESLLALMISRKLFSSVRAYVLTMEQRVLLLPLTSKLVEQLCVRGVDYQHCMEEFCFQVMSMYSSTISEEEEEEETVRREEEGENEYEDGMDKFSFP